ncbi:MAG: efflux transporter periplasmic adaptor subunit [Betaproteobacteria bacterium RIFCSPLOWO2_02_FULL_67_19]|nr:MAG: efflux transporter periplasmic adaptor subunit [Betaproteobacteria bacterium RIFCSPLOWO2_02_FULL_67_19]
MATTKRKRILFIAGALALIAALATLATTLGPFAPIRVSVAPVQTAPLNPSVFGVGTLEARLSYAVGPTQAGRVARVHVDHGDAVKAGQTLAEMDPVDLAERLAASGSALERARQSARAAEAQIREAESRHQVALTNANRYRELAQKGFVSKELADNRRSEANVTAAAADAARASLAAAQGDAARLDSERGAAAKQLANLKLVSPVDAIVVARLAEPGTTVVAGQAVFRLVDPSSVWVRARVDQARAGGLAAGDAAEIVLRSAQGGALPGRVARVDIESDAVTEERIVNLEFTTRPPSFSIGELAEVTIRRPAVANALVVPSAAVKMLGDRRGVWRVDAGRARFHRVKIGLQTLEGQTHVLEGLAPGDEVIVYTRAQLSEGARLRVVVQP